MSFRLPSIADVLECLVGILSVTSNLVTVIIGIATIYGFFRYKKKISAAFKLMRFQHLHERKAEINETLELIALAQIPKGKANEVRALFARLNGQLMPICTLIPELRSMQEAASEIAHDNGRLNDAVRQQIVHQVKAVFEHARFQAVDEAAGEVG